MEAFNLDELLKQQSSSKKLYLEFLRATSLSLGLYVLPPGAADPQQPHLEDEVYYVIRGSGFFRQDKEEQAVKAGSILFVKANLTHHFFNISEELVLLVFFAPPEGSSQK